jgi:hypothetical protein
MYYGRWVVESMLPRGAIDVWFCGKWSNEMRVDGKMKRVYLNFSNDLLDQRLL